MNELIGRVFAFEQTIFAAQRALFGKLVREGQHPRALIVSCADSRIVPEQIVQAVPGDLFVCRNAGNLVPAYGGADNGGVIATIEYGVAVLGIRDIIVCGHADCGAMKAVSDPSGLDALPDVKAWLRHAAAAEQLVSRHYAHLDKAERVRAISLENIVAQLQHLRTHPAVAAGLAAGEIALHGWFVDIHAGQVLGLDGATGRFALLRADRPLPVAQPARSRLAADLPFAVAAE